MQQERDRILEESTEWIRAGKRLCDRAHKEINDPTWLTSHKNYRVQVMNLERDQCCRLLDSYGRRRRDWLLSRGKGAVSRIRRQSWNFAM